MHLGHLKTLPNRAVGTGDARCAVVAATDSPANALLTREAPLFGSGEFGTDNGG
jgi:hypothetical protein